MKKVKTYFALAFCIILGMNGCDSEGNQERDDTIRVDIHLSVDIDPDAAQRIGWQSVYGPWHGKDGERYTGTQTYYYQENGEDSGPFLVRTFENGRLLQEMAHHENGEIMAQTDYKYVSDTVVRVVDWYPDGTMRSEIVHHSVTEDGLGYIKEWHENGELKFYTKIDGSNQYTGLMTLRDEEGEIIKHATN